MEVINHFNLLNLSDTFVSLLAAFILGSIIGFERQYRQRTAGLRTNVLVAIGAAIFVDAASTLNGHVGGTQVMAYVVSGIGFLGAGVIMREEGNIRGLNTAATLWGSAAVGACAGADLIGEAVLGTIFVLSANTLLRPIVDYVNRIPIDAKSSEVTYSVYVIVAKEYQKQALTLLEELLEFNKYPLSGLEVHAFGATDIEIEATLLSTAVDGEILDKIVEQLKAEQYISQVFWSSSTSE